MNKLIWKDKSPLYNNERGEYFFARINDYLSNGSPNGISEISHNKYQFKFEAGRLVFALDDVNEIVWRESFVHPHEQEEQIDGVIFI